MSGFRLRSSAIAVSVTFCLVLFASAGSSPADTMSIGLNFVGSGGSGMTSTDTAGVSSAQAANWNNLVSPVGGPNATYSGSLAAGNVNLNDGSTASATTVDWSFYGHPGTAGSGTDDTKMFLSKFDPWGGPPSLTLTVNNIPFDEYIVYVYTGQGDGFTGRGGTVTIGSETRAVQTFPTHPLTYVESTDTSWSGSSTSVGTLVRFTGLSGDLNLTTYANAGRFQVAGVQIVESPEPSTLAMLLGLGGIGLLGYLRRRRRS